MFFNSEYLRYKQNMERMRAKVKEREEMRKELEIKFKKLMKERNECEKTASVHKSKYDFLLEQERRRMARNSELLHMLENIDGDGVTATRTERLELLKTDADDRTSPMNRWRRNYQQLSLSPYSNELPSRQTHNHSQRRSASATRPFAYACPSSASTKAPSASTRDIEIESIDSSENNNNNQFTVSAPSSAVRHPNNRNFMMNYNPIHLQRQIMPLPSSVYRLSTTTTTTATRTRRPHSHYTNDADDDDDDDLTASISTIAPINNQLISHRHSNAIAPSTPLSTYRHYPIVRRPFTDLPLQPYWKRNAETQTTNENASFTPENTQQYQTYYNANRYSQLPEHGPSRYQPSTLSRYRNYYGNVNDNEEAVAAAVSPALASSTVITPNAASSNRFDRTNQFEYLANTTLPSWRSATELYKLPHETQISTATNASNEYVPRPTYYSSTQPAIENVNQPRIHYQNQRNQFSFINEAPAQQPPPPPPQQQQQPYSALSTSLQPTTPHSSALALRGDGQPYTYGTLDTRTNAQPLQMDSNVDADSALRGVPLSRDAANGLSATQSNERWLGQPTAYSANNATAKWIESREPRNDYGNQAYEYATAATDPDKSKINELVTDASTPSNDKWSAPGNFQRKQIHAQIAQMADTQDQPKYVSAELNLPYRATVYDYPPTPQQQQQTSNVYDEHSQQQQQQARRRLSHDNYAASKSDDDLMMAKKQANGGNQQRRYSVATHLYDYQQNYPKSEPISLPSATAMTATSQPASDWNANEMLQSRYASNDDNVKDYSSEKSQNENSAPYVSSDIVRYDDGGGGGAGVADVTQYAQSDLQPQTRSDGNDNFIENQMGKLALDEPQRDVEIEGGSDRNYSPNGKYSKTVTWADDPQMKFKRDTETTPAYDSNQPNGYQGDAGAVETSPIDSNQQQQQQQQQLYQYENESYATEANAPIQYSVSGDVTAELQQSDGGDQGQNYYYGDGNYADSSSEAATGAAIDPATGAYYDQSGQQVYQDQYYYEDGQDPQQQQPQQQYDAQQPQQYTQEADATGYVQDPQQQQYADGYQYTNYPDQSNAAAEPQDPYYQQSDSNYYQTEPGANYYSSETPAIDPNYQPVTDYSAADYDQSQLTSDSRQYTDGSEAVRLDGDNNSSMANYQSTSYGAMQQPSARPDKIPNYLQSDTEDSSQSGAVPASTAGNVQSHVQAAHDSDFDFSTNS